jgi:hypothetical protein
VIFFGNHLGRSWRLHNVHRWWRTSRSQLGTQMSVESCGVVYCSQDVPKHVVDCPIYTLTFQCTYGRSDKLIPSIHHLCIRKKTWKGICSCLLQQAVWSNCDVMLFVRLCAQIRCLHLLISHLHNLTTCSYVCIHTNSHWLVTMLINSSLINIITLSTRNLRRPYLFSIVMNE